MTPVLSVKNLDVSFATRRGEARVLRDVSLDVGKGRIVAVVGESGSGKSTLALAILRLLPSNLARLGGEILLESENLLALPDDQMRRLRGSRIAMVFQDPMTALNPVFSIETQMVDVQRAKRGSADRRAIRKRAVDMLDRVGIPDADRRIGNYPHEFSGGMRQRIMIAMALLSEAHLLIADEPTTALDVTIEAQIVRLFEQVRSEFGVSIIFITHSLGLVAELCDDVVVMYAGRVVESGPAAEVFARPAHPYTRALLACELSTRDEVGTRVLSIPGEVPDLTDVPPGCVFHTRCPDRMAECRVHNPELRQAEPRHHAACLLVPEA